MAYLMSDVTAGSNAALQLQQNMAAAPDVQQVQANKMQEQQFILQQNQNKIQQDAAKAEQDAATLQKTNLSNLVLDTNFKASEDIKGKLKELLNTQPAKDALLKNDRIAFMNLVLPIQLAAGDSANASDTMKTISELEFKKVQTDLKQHEKNREIFGSASATIRSATDDQIPELISKMPEEMKSVIKAQIPEFFKQTDRKLQKAQLEALVANGSGRNDLATNEMRIKVLDLQLLLKAEMLKIQEQIYENKKLTGSTKDDKADAHMYNIARRDASRIDSLYKKPLEEAVAKFKKDTEEDKKTSLFGFRGSPIDRAKSDEDKAALKSTKAWVALQDLQKDILNQKMDALDGMPEGREKERLFNSYSRQMESLGGAAPERTPSAVPDKSRSISDSSLPPLPDGLPKESNASQAIKDKVMTAPGASQAAAAVNTKPDLQLNTKGVADFKANGIKTHDGYPARQNADGSYSTEVSITVTNPKLNGGKPTNIPSLWYGKEVDENTAVNNVLASGKKYESFSTIPEAVKAAKEKSNAGGAAAPNKAGGKIVPKNSKTSPTPMPLAKEDLMKDNYYTTPRGLAKWDGSKFVTE
jgi:hypothetical protein